MRAVIFRGFGGSDVLELADVPRPTCQAGELLVKVSHAGVNPVDYKIHEGMLRAIPTDFPVILGWECAGTVAEVGTGLSGWKVGDPVFAYARKPRIHAGTFAEYVALEPRHAAPAPRTISPAQAAGVPLTALTSWQALFGFARVVAGNAVLVHAGAGGAGGFGVQLAAQRGARVISTASGANREYVLSLGAENVIDYRGRDFAQVARELVPGGFDAIFDTVGGETLARSFPLCKRGGRLVSIVDVPSAERAKELGVESAHVFVEPNSDQLITIARWIDEKKLSPLPTEEVPLEQAADALTRLRERHVRGKLVLRV
jgi:NADPH2:quinone reductase